jgi:murein DD-endopeptidase MepM/ murein hydrolase activator NlpD
MSESSRHDTIEIQIHPIDVRGRVRSMRARRQQLRWLRVLAGAYLLFLVAGLATAPRVVGGLLRHSEYRIQLARRGQQGERLQALVDRLSELDRQTRDLEHRVEKIHDLYGLAPEPALEELSQEPAGGERSIFAATIERGETLLADVGRRSARLDRQLGEVRGFEAAHPEAAPALPAALPLEGTRWVLTSLFGTRRSPFTRDLEFHTGIDLAAPLGTSVLAAGAGTVAFAGPVPVAKASSWWRLGNVVVVRHDDRFLSIYGHVDRILVAPGTKLRRGQAIATVGNSGWSSAPHLHFEVWKRDGGAGFSPLDPRDAILDRRFGKEAPATPAAGGEAPPFAPLPPAFLRG